MLRSCTAVVLCAVLLFATACNPATILGYLQQVAPTVIAVLNLVAAFGGPAVEQNRVDAINKESANVIDLYQKFINADQASKQDALSRFHAAYETMMGNLTEVLNTARVMNPETQRKVAAAVSAAFLLLNQIELLIPGTSPTPAQAKAAKAGHFFKSPSEFKVKFNQLLTDAGHAELGLK